MSDDLKDTGGRSRSPIGPIAGGATRVLQRTARAISPWVRRWWMGAGASPATSNAPSGNLQPAGVPGRMPGYAPLALRVQRSVAFGGVPAGGGELVDRFSHSILQRHTVAEQIGRRYHIETRQLATLAPSQLPLSGVGVSQSPARIQRAPGEMSLDELAHSFQMDAMLDAEPPSTVQRQVDPAFGEAAATSAQMTSLTEMQEAVRRSAQMRASSAAPASSLGESTPVQRSPEVGPGSSLVAAIEERIRQARQRTAAQSGTPAAASGVPAPQVQRSPAVPPTPSSTPLAVPPRPRDAATVQSEIEARLNAARAKMGRGQTSTPVRQSSNPPVLVQRAQEQPAQVQRASAAELDMLASWDTVLRRPAAPPSTDPSSSGFSVASALKERIQRKREEQATAASSRLLTREERIQRADPTSPNYSKAEAIRQRIEEARVQRQPARFSANPEDSNYSVSEHLRQRIASANAAQRSVENAPPAPPEMVAPQASALPSTVPPSMAQQIRDRIQAARDRNAANAASSASVPPASETPPMPHAANLPGASAPESVQRAPDERIPVVRDLQTNPNPLASRDLPPQVKRVRALSRSQILTPERKTGDFLAGETPKPGAMPLHTSSRPPSATVQRTPDATPVNPPTPPSATQAENELPASAETPASSVGADEPAQTVQRSLEPSAATPQETAVSDTQSKTPPPVLPTAPDVVQRAAEASVESTASTPEMPPVQQAVEGPDSTISTAMAEAASHDSVQRAPEAAATSEAAAPLAAKVAAEAPVAHTAEAGEATPTAATPPVSSSIPETVQRTAESMAETDGESQPSAPAAGEQSTPFRLASPAMPEVAQSAPETSPASVSDVPSPVEAAVEPLETPAAVQRASEPQPVLDTSAGQISKSEAPVDARSVEIEGNAPAPTQSAVQRSLESGAESEAASSPSLVQRASDVTNLAPLTTIPEGSQRTPGPREEGEAAAPPVQRAVEPPAAEATDAPQTEEPELVRRSPEPGVSTEPVASIPATPVTGSVQAASDTPLEASASSAPEVVQRTPVLPAETAAVEPTTQRTVATPDIATPDVATPSAAPEPRTDNTPSAPSVEAASGHVDLVQRAPEPRAASEAAAPPVQRAVETPGKPAAEITPPAATPEVVQRMPEPSAPSARDAAEIVETAPRPVRPETVQRNAEIGAADTETAPVEPRGTTSEPAPAAPESPLQREMEAQEPASTVEIPEMVQRSPRPEIAGQRAAPPAQTEAAAHEAAPVTPAASTPEVVQRSPDSGIPGPSMESGPFVLPRQDFAETTDDTTRPSVTEPGVATSPTPDVIQRTPEPTVQAAPSLTGTTQPAFRPINRYRDPRVLSRSLEPNPPQRVAEVPLMQAQPAAFLPHAGNGVTMPLAPARIQRSPVQAELPVMAAEASPPESTGRVEIPSLSSGTRATTIPGLVQRRYERTSERPQQGEHRAVRVQSAPSKTVNRSPLPLAKKSVSPTRSEVVQRDTEGVKNDDALPGSSPSGGTRGGVLPQNIGGSEKVREDRSGASAQEDEGQDLDRLARAILPAVKQMLAIERDRRTTRSRF